MKVLLENLLRYEDGRTVTKADIEAVAAWLDNRGKVEKEIAYRRPASSCRTSRAYPPWSTWPPCATPCTISAAIRAGSTRWCRSTS